MLPIPCPFCGVRPETEFVCAGEVMAPRPSDPQAVSDAVWADWVVMRDNTRGAHAERWWHARGCGGWFVLRRNTVTHELLPADPVVAGAP